MKVTLIETKECDGDWYKVLVDDMTKACLKKNGTRPPEETLKRAEEIFQFYYENNGKDKILKEFETTQL